MKARGLMRDVQSPVANAVGETLGGVLPIVAAAKAPQIAAGLLKMGENAAARTPMNAATGNQTGAIVWHGSPHKFDRFDASKIGTGEGAQVYGHGLYLAENPKVAAEYQRNLGGLEMRDRFGAVLPIPENVQWVANDLAAAGGDYKKIRAQLAEHSKSYPWPAEVGTKYINELEAAGAKPNELGSLYKVDLPDDQIAKMLDWDKPLSQQPWVMSRVSPLLEDSKASQEAIRQLLGRDVIAQDGPLAAYAGPNRNAKMFSEILRQEKIPGIRYLDGGSRGAGSGSSNFVVFPGNEGLLNILERNGQPIR
jgi:hypothetical protein